MDKEKFSRIKIDISLSTIIKIVAVILAIVFLQKVQDIVLMLFVVLILVTALSPIVDRLVARLNIPRWLAVTIIFGGVALLLVVIVALVIPMVVTQMLELLNQPQVRSVLGITDSNTFLDEIRLISGQFSISTQEGATGFISFFSTLFGGAVSVITVFVISLYLLLDEDGIKKFILTLLPTQHKLQIVNTFHKIGLKLGSWLRGQLSLGLIVGVADLVVLLIFGVPYWMTLAIFAGVTELVPYIGPFIGLGAALFVALSRDSIWGFNHITVGIGIAIGYLLVQQLESHFLVPKIMEKSVGLNPVIIIIAILVGAKLFGLLGVLLSVPAAAIISVVIDEWPDIQTAYLNTRRNAEKAMAEE